MRALAAVSELVEGLQATSQLQIQHTHGWVIGGALLGVVLLCCLFFSHPPKDPEAAGTSSPPAGADATQPTQGKRTAATSKNTTKAILPHKACSSAVKYVTIKDLAQVTGLRAEDPFLTSVAQHFRWSPAATSSYTPIEEGVNAGVKAAAAAGTSSMASRWLGGASLDSAGPMPVQLTAQQVKEQVELMADGLISTGPISVLFKACWAAKFGPKTLVAIKILRDPYAQQQQNLKMFEYEVDVLSRCRHPNIIRIYGWCFEPPCVCILTELLPTSLQAKLYGVEEPTHDVPSSSSIVNNHPAYLSTPLQSSGVPTRSPPDSIKTAAHDMAAGRSKLDPTGRYAGSEVRPHTASAPGSVTGTLGTPGNSGVVLDSNRSRTGAQSHGADRPDTSLRTLQTLPYLEVLQLACDIAAGLAHLHATPDARITPPSSATASTEILGLGSRGKLAAIAVSGLSREPSAASASSLQPVLATVAQSRQPSGTSQFKEVHDSDLGSMPDLTNLTDLIEDDEEDEDVAPGGRVLQRVVHRDIRPVNILVNSKGMAKISEFALAREHYSTTVVTDGIRQSGSQRAGTLRYMAPELLSGQTYARITDKIDIFSFGVLLWEMGLRQRPWTQFSDLQVAAMVQEGKRPPLPSSSSSSGLASRIGSSGLPNTPISLAAQLRAMSSSQLDLNDLPADCVFRKVPQYEALVRSCWQATAQRRPKASALCKHLQLLLDKQLAAAKPK